MSMIVSIDGMLYFSLLLLHAAYRGARFVHQGMQLTHKYALFESTASALDSASGSVPSSEALSTYPKYAQFVKTTAGPN